MYKSKQTSNKTLELFVEKDLINLNSVRKFRHISILLFIISFIISKYLYLCIKNNPPTIYLLEALELCITYSNCIFNSENYLHTDGTTQGPCMSCSYADIAMADLDKRASEYHFSPTIWKKFRHDISVL